MPDSPLKFVRPDAKHQALFLELQALVEKHQTAIPLPLIVAIFANMAGGIGAHCRTLTREQIVDTVDRNFAAGWDEASKVIRAHLS
jgi:uncharacterized protein YejL (UPF0352 family)